MDLKLGGLERTTTPEGVYRVLRAAILNGAVPPGGQLREREIAEDLAVSRSPLREALTRLEEEGLIVKIPFRGAFVREVSAQEVAEIASVRLLVEPFAGELARQALRGPERARFTQTLEDFSRATEAGDVPGQHRCTPPVPPVLLRASRDTGCSVSLWEGWESKLRLYLSVDHRSYGDLHDIAVEHESLAAVALEGDAEAFRQELARHFESALRGRTEAPGQLEPRRS